MKKIWLLIPLFFLLLLIGTLLFLQLQPQRHHKNSINYYINTQQEFFIIKGKEISLFFTANASTTQEIATQHDCKVTTNGSYFGRNSDGTFFPAGIRYSGMELLHTASQRELSDPNLQTLISFPQFSGAIQFWTNTHNFPPQENTILFNAGPILFQSGEKNAEINNKTSHRQGRYPRTILIITDKQETYFLLITKKVTLPEATDIIEQIPNLWANFSAINLDGWPSTSSYSKLLKKLTFNENEKLPIFFCIK